MEGSILDSLGVEIIGVMSPVSICMLLVVLLIYSLDLSSSAVSSVPIRTAANLVYLENPSDTTATKIEGSLLNALVFVVLIALVTFLLVLLYYYNFTNFLKNYMRFSTLFVLGTLGGSIFLSIIQHFSIPIDSITFFLLLFNFSVVGVLSVFSGGFPIIIRQSYMVCLGIIVAAWFTKSPEWTTWTLLVALALYDLVAVLAPGGPLKMLVELASSRDEELPALIYEARPTTTGSSRRGGGSILSVLVMGASDTESSGAVELQTISRGNNNTGIIDIDEGETSPLVPSRSPQTGMIQRRHGGGYGSSSSSGDEEERSPLVDDGNERAEVRRAEENEEIGEKRGIKLGLGDFVFYSVLVGRAAMYDLMTVYACYIGIISGLGCTLILLSVFRRALPALPISITLGVIFYFLTRLVMEPFIVGASTKLIMF